MKKQLTKKVFWQSLLSAITLGIFILLAVGSVLDNFLKYKVEYQGDGIYKETDYLSYKRNTIKEGRKDDKGKWNGQVEFSSIDDNIGTSTTEKVTMAHGVRHGESITTYRYLNTIPIVKHRFYYMGRIIDGEPVKSTFSSMADISAFQILVKKYPWFFYSLNAFGFDSLYVKAYMDTFETKLSAYAYDVTKFDDYYGDVNGELEETPYDSIITFNSQLTMFQGLEAMKNSELRLAIIDHYRSAGSTTFNIISTTYPGYLLNMNNQGVNNQDFKDFCQNMDTRMTSYGALNLQDPFFIDSVDARMFRAILAISNAGKSSSLSAEPSVNNMLQNYKNYDINDIYDEVIQMLKSSFSKSTPKEVATIVMNDMLWQYYIPAEIIRQAVMEAYFIKGGVKRVPVAATVFESNNSPTSAILQGYVIEDGGAAVTSRGIAWSTFYNPTNNNNPVSSGTGTGKFNVTLTGLTAGTTYYARTYATNSAGTAYGNCISFIANITTDINDIKLFTRDLTIYPNPASSLTTFSFQLETPVSIMLYVIDMKGKVVLKNDPGSLPQGENQVMVNLSVLQNGMYICQLTNGKTKITRKFVVSH